MKTVAQLTPEQGRSSARKRGMPYERLTALLVGGRDQAGLVALGAQAVSATKWAYDAASSCQSPRDVVMFARPSDPHRRYRKRTGSHLVELTMKVRCRKCDKCRKWRSRIWTERARTECRLAPRTWFLTLTFKPELQHRAVSFARRKLASQGLDFDTLPFGEQFAEHQWQTSPLVTKWLKRLRKQSATQFRYLLVAEHHKTGWPHYHALIHEKPGLSEIRKAVLEQTWGPMGFIKARLVNYDEEGYGAPAAYVCKYLAKSSAARVRASGLYGQV